MSAHTDLPIDTVEGALGFADSYIVAYADEFAFEPDDIARSFETLVAELLRLRPELAYDPHNH